MLLCALSRLAFAEDLPPALRLATELAAEGDHAGAAVEFRRLALGSSSARNRAGFLWAAAHECWRGGQFETADKLLDRAEDEDPALGETAVLLRGENAVSQRNWDEASFYLESVVNGHGGDDEKTVAARRLAAVRLVRKDVPGARDALARSPAAHEDGLAAIDGYARGRDKRPVVGGLLGIIPGLGYMYAGEWSNGFRSLILNGLFIFGMASTAEDDEWGAFAVISFFELTWYTGSIYGGVDASHRFNERRLQGCVDRVEGASGFEPDYGKLPVLSLRFEF